MAPIPEIIGETREEALERNEALQEQESAGEPVLPPWRAHHQKPRPLTETRYGASPFMIRLCDFSGQGERAPPAERYGRGKERW